MLFSVANGARRASLPLEGKVPPQGADEVVCEAEEGPFTPLRGYTSSVTFDDSCALRSTRSAALTAHRAVIHYRGLRFAYLKEKPLRLRRCRQQFTASLHSYVCCGTIL